MFGFADPWIALVYILSVASSLLCVIYGVITWNKGDEPAKQEDVQWAAEEKAEVEESITPR